MCDNLFANNILANNMVRTEKYSRSDDDHAWHQLLAMLIRKIYVTIY